MTPEQPQWSDLPSDSGWYWRWVRGDKKPTTELFDTYDIDRFALFGGRADVKYSPLMSPSNPFADESQ